MKLGIFASVLVLSTSANAAVVNTLNNIQYEWLELSATAGMSRLDVMGQINNTNSELYGYEYATREQVEDLLLSYSGSYAVDGITGSRSESSVVTGLSRFLDDFGSYSAPSSGRPTTTGDGDLVYFDTIHNMRGLYGFGDTCSQYGGFRTSCISNVIVYSQGDEDVAAVISQSFGWNSQTTTPYLASDDLRGNFGSHLVRVVPIPAAVWLFGSGLIGLAGFARRKKA